MLNTTFTIGIEKTEALRIMACSMDEFAKKHMILSRRVLIVCSTYEQLGGLQFYVKQMAEAIRDNGWKVDVLCPMQSGEQMVDGISVFGGMPPNRIIRRGLREFASWWLALHPKLHFGRYDLVIIAHVNLLPMMQRFLELTKKPSWLVTYGIEIWNPWEESYYRGIRKLSHIVAISRFTGTKIAERLCEVKDRIRIIAPSVDVNRFRPSESTLSVEKKDKYVLLTVARLAADEQYKGHDLVIEALSKLRGMLDKDIEYQIAGDGDDRKRLEQLVLKHGVGDCVTFLGYEPDDKLVLLYQNCDLFVMPSYVAQRTDGTWTGEGFGIVFTEAGACGKPVIGCDEGGQTDVIVQNVNGLMVKPNPQEICQAIYDILSDSQKMNDMGEAGMKIARENFSNECFRQKWAKLMAEMESVF